MIVRTPAGLAPGRIAWREGERGRMVPRVVVGDRELGPATVEVLDADDERAEALQAAGYRVNVK